jgi:ATP:ADP antiporter, AAA family
MALLNRLFSLKPGEVTLVLALGFLLFCNSLAVEVSYVVSVSGFLSEVGVDQFLWVFGISYSLILLMLAFQSLIVDRFDRKRLMRRMIIGFVVAFIILRCLFVGGAPPWLTYSLSYILTEQQWLLFPLIFWVLANDLVGTSQTKRLFPLIAGLGFVGKFAGVGIATLAPSLFERWHLNNHALLTVNIAMYLVAYAIAKTPLKRWPLRNITHKSETLKETLTEGWGFIQEVPAFRYLVISLLALAICDTVIEFRFFGVTEAAFPEAANFQTFYGTYRLIMILSAWALQSFATSHILNDIGIKNSFLVMPIAMLVGLLLMTFLPGLPSSVGAILLARLSWDTLDESARKSFQSLVPEERRGRVSLFMDGYLLALGTLLGSLITGVVIFLGKVLNYEQSFYIYLGIGLTLALIAFIAILQMRKVYDQSLFNWRLKRRQRSKTVLDRLNFD